MNLILSVFATIILFLLSPAANAGIIETASTAATVLSIKQAISGLIDEATNSGDYLAFKFAIEMKGVVESWEKANSRLLDQAFNRLGEQQQAFFRNLDSIISRSSIEIGAHLETTTQLAELIDQTVADAKFWDGKPAVFRILPSVIHPAITQDINVIVRGVNLDDANPRLRLPNGHILQSFETKKMEVRFALSKEAFTFDTSKATILPVTLLMKVREDGLWAWLRSSSKEVEVPLSLMQLPTVLGRIAGYAATSTDTRVYKYVEREFLHSDGSIDFGCKDFNQDPSTDHLIDVDSIAPYARPHPQAGQTINVGFARITFPPDATLPTEWGKAGKWSFSFKRPQGFSVQVCAKRYTEGFPPNTGPGFQHVYMRWKEYRTDTVEARTSLDLKTLQWTTDIRWELPPNTKSVALTLKLFNGQQREVSGAFADTFFQAELDSQNRFIIVRPRIPQSITGL